MLKLLTDNLGHLELQAWVSRCPCCQTDTDARIDDVWEKEDLEKGIRFVSGIINLLRLCETSTCIICTKLHPLVKISTVHQRLLSTGHGRPSRNREAKHMHTFINHRGFLLCKICYCYWWSKIVFYGWLWEVSLIVFSGLMSIWVLWRFRMDLGGGGGKAEWMSFCAWYK